MCQVTRETPELKLPYIGVNVDRLPSLVGAVLESPLGHRSPLQQRWAQKFAVSEKTAKEYISSLANLGILARVSRSAVELAIEKGTNEHDLLVRFQADSDWSAFFAFASVRVPALELLRAIYVDREDELRSASRAASVAALRRDLKQAGVQGTARSKTLEAFLRILERARPSTAPPPPRQGILRDQLSLRLREAVDSLSPAEFLTLEVLIGACRTLADIHPVYARTAVFSIGDILQMMSVNARDLAFTKTIKRLRDKNLVLLHRTIPSAAAQLNLVTVADGSAVASALSFPRRLWTAGAGNDHA